MEDKRYRIEGRIVVEVPDGTGTLKVEAMIREALESSAIGVTEMTVDGDEASREDWEDLAERAAGTDCCEGEGEGNA